MPRAVYHPLSINDSFETRVNTFPAVWWEAWSYSAPQNGMQHWTGSMGPNGTLSLYGGIRGQSGHMTGSVWRLVTSGTWTGTRTAVTVVSSTWYGDFAIDIVSPATMSARDSQLAVPPQFGVPDVYLTTSYAPASTMVYPLDEVDTHSIDKIIQISGTYPASGAINLAYCTNTPANSYITDVTDQRWYDTHYRAIEGLARWHSNFNTNYNWNNYAPLMVVHIPSLFYGRQISPGTLSMSLGEPLRFYSEYTDNSRGGVVTGSTQVGMIFYVEGLIVLWDNAFFQGYGEGSDYAIRVAFSGSQPVIAKTFMCRIHENECNCSRNPTWSHMVSGTLVRSGSDSTTYISSVGLYNEDYELVAVAKMAQPIRKREQDRLDIRLRMDF